MPMKTPRKSFGARAQVARKNCRALTVGMLAKKKFE